MNHIATTQPPSAAELNDHLSRGGVVTVSTHLRHTVYRQKHAGMFYNGAKTGNLYVKAGRKANCLAAAGLLLVTISKTVR